MRMQRMGNGMIVQRQVWVESQDFCRQENKLLEAEIEKGMPDGHEITFAHAGNQDPGKAPGDVVMTVQQQQHPTFTRKGDDFSVPLCAENQAKPTGSEENFSFKELAPAYELCVNQS